MRRVSGLVALAAALVLGATIVPGCREAVEQTALQRFAARYADLPPATALDSLRTHLGSPGETGVFASFLAGNLFHNEAADSAAVSGWDQPVVSALLDSAEVHFAAAVAGDSTFVEALVNLGSVWDDRSEQRVGRDVREERVLRAEQYYLRAAAVDPANEKALCNLGGLYLRQRRTHDALAQFQKVLDHDPQSALAHYNLAIMFAEQKIYREALREWELAAKCDPDGDIGERSRENVKIVHDLMNAPDPQGAAH